MKIVFVPNYFYLHIPLFQEIIYQLSDKGVTSYIWKLPGNTNVPADREFDLSYFRSREINFYEAPVYQIQNYKENARSKLKLLRYALKNWEIIRGLLLDWKPDLVVVGSDLGNLNIRFLMDACHFYHIPVVVLYNCDLPKAKRPLNFFHNLKYEYIFKSKVLSLLRAIFSSGNIPGKYSLDSIICVATEEIRQKIISEGIREDRIIVTGMNFMNSSPIDLSEDIFKRLGISNTCRIVVLFTECIHDIYGIKYAENLYIELAKIADDLPDDIFLVVKPHPQESEEMRSLLTKTFNGLRCKVVSNFKAEELIEVAGLCIAHFSRVLITTALMDKRFLSINLMNDRERTFLTNQESEVLEITSYEGLIEKIRKALENSEFKNNIDKAIASISHRFSSKGSLEKIINVIINTQR
jgi:hypothetical protein